MSPKKDFNVKMERMFNTMPVDLTYIDLSKQDLEEIPPQLYEYDKVENLYLSDNKIDELPDDFFDHFRHLKWLDLRNNMLSSIPYSIGEHSNLKNLLLEGNFIEYLPRELGKTSLTGLSLSGNPLIYPPDEVVKGGVRTILNYLNTDDDMEEEESNDEEDFVREDTIKHRNYKHEQEYSHQQPTKDSMEFDSNNYMRNIYSYDDNLENHGPLPVAASFHNPPTFAHYKEKSKLMSFAKLDPATASRSKTSQDRMKDVEYLKNERRKNKKVLDEWRADARKLQQSLLPRSKTDITILPPYGIDLEESLRPITSEERTVHSNVHEEKVDKVLPKHKPSNKEVRPKVNHRRMKNKAEDLTVKDILNMNHVIKPRETVGEKVVKESAPKGDNETIASLIKRSKNLRERLESEVATRMRQYSNQLQSRKQPRQVKESQSRELQRQLLDRKMNNDPQMEYRFKAFTGDNSSGFSSSNQTTSM